MGHGPSCGRFTDAKNLIQFMLLEKRECRVEAEDFENARKAILDFQGALPFSVDEGADLCRANNRAEGHIHARWAFVVLISRGEGCKVLVGMMSEEVSPIPNRIDCWEGRCVGLVTWSR